MDEMYREIILDYYRNPRNKGHIHGANVESKDTNTLCGDVIEITANIENDKIKEVKFEGRGCAISQASASMLTEFLEGKTVEEVSKLQKSDIENMLGGIELSHARIKCALLSLKVAKMGVYSYIGKKMTADEQEELGE